MSETAIEQPVKQVEITRESTPVVQQTTLLLTRIEKQKERLAADPRPVLDSVDSIKLFQICMDQQGFSQNRGQTWQAIAHAAVPQLDVVYESILDKHQKTVYASVIEKEVQAIKLPTEPTAALVRILSAYSLYDPQVGYCHGMAGWVAPLLEQMGEKGAFSTLIRLMELYELRDIYTNGLSSVLDTFQLLLAQTCPELKHHLDQLRIYPSVYAAPWFLSLFTQSALAPELTLRLYDHIFLEGAIECCLRLSVYLLQKSEKRLQKASKSECLAYFQSADFYRPACDFHDMMRLNSSVAHQIHQTADIRQNLADLQKERTELKIQTMEQEASLTKVAQQNRLLEKRVKKYKVKYARQAVQALPTPPVIQEEEAPKDNFHLFVESLRGSGDLGALIAGAISTKTPHPNSSNNSSSDEEEEEADTHEKRQPATALQDVTAELVALQMEHYQTKERYDALCRHYENLNRQWQQTAEAHAAMTQKIIYLSSELEDTAGERDQLYGDQEGVLEMAMVAKKTATELQLEKMTLMKDIERLEQVVRELENEKQAYFMPRDTFSEEVFAAHQILFGQKKEQSRPTVHTPPDLEYKTKFAESELRCRELEKYLAEAKVKLAEFESTLLYPPSRRTSSVHLKRSSTASILARVSTPTTEPRASTESYASSVTSLTSINSSQYNSKRSSMYSRIWNAFGTHPVPTAPNHLKNSILCQEPQII
ncbi:rab-GTPase-TBC domain-containing protein [Sporodiniella umbellata]|nr:rab-GTPase-TBC domain-containing protein [Sporodiniella umbellata]